MGMYKSREETYEYFVNDPNFEITPTFLLCHFTSLEFYLVCPCFVVSGPCNCRLMGI